MRDDHVAVGAGLFVKPDALSKFECFRHVDLDMVDEVAVPDGLEQTIGKAEGKDVLGRFLAEEMVDPENLFLGKDPMQLGVQRDSALEIGAERLLHDDARPLGEFGIRQELHDLQRGVWRHTQIMNSPAVLSKRLLGSFNSRLERPRTRAKRHVVEHLFKRDPVLLDEFPGREPIECGAHDGSKTRGIDCIK